MARKLDWLPALEPELRAAYQSPGRAYHNWRHISDLLVEFQRLAMHWRNPAAVETAIYWHDVIYEPTSPTNEVDSAALMRARVIGRAPRHLVENAAALILATADHATPPGMDAGLAADCALFLDMDMSILGASPEAFDAYDAAIRSEFSALSDEVYQPRRAEVLSGFLKRPRLFLSDIYYGSHETQARANLRRAISRLS